MSWSHPEILNVVNTTRQTVLWQGAMLLRVQVTSPLLGFRTGVTTNVRSLFILAVRMIVVLLVSRKSTADLEV